ncbi:hypothetical protein RND81_12G074000 [Saponaria officinalis]|uniref:Tf2-1-like SH3-like domain-containing protein n=1 Tax=Saponaria officinalis TaxID=3572 RepID=A0AAW1H7N8_SAPOF
MDFITGLPISQGDSVILVVVDRLTKYSHLVGLPAHFNALLVAKTFIDTVVKLHEYCLNTTYHEGLKMTPFQALYGRVPPSIPAYSKDESKVPAIDEMLRERDEALTHLRDNLLEAQHRMSQRVNKGRRELEFQPGDMVLLRLQPYRQHSVTRCHHHKLSRRYCGPFQIMERIGKVAYKLALPAQAKIHPVFHVSLLKLFRGDITIPHAPLPLEFIDGKPLYHGQ